MKYDIRPVPKNPIIDIVIGVADRGGVENVINMFGRYLAKHGVCVRVIQLVWEHHSWTCDEIEFHYLSDNRYGWDLEKAADAYSEFLLKQGKPDLVLATNWPYMSQISRQALEKVRCSCLIGSWLHNPIERYEANGYGGLDSLLYADFHLAINNRIANNILDRFHDAVIYRTNNPVRTDRSVFAEDRFNSKRLVFVGRLTEQKNLPLILKALIIAPAEWELAVYGEGESGERHDLEAYCNSEPLLSDRVHFYGWKDNPWENETGSFGLVMASVFEGFPLTAIEALACGMPVIATPADGLAELIHPGENGYLYPNNDHESLAKILQFISERKLPPINSKNCRESVKMFQEDTALGDMYLKCVAALRGRILIPQRYRRGNNKLILNDRISVIIPCYNVMNVIRRCLDSILRQSIGIKCLEIILVDDVSTDDTLSVLREYEQRFPDQIKLISLETNGGSGNARNVGLTQASGEYITFIDADDYIADDMLEKLYLAINSYSADMAECNFTIFDNEPAACDQDNEGDVFYAIENEQDRKAFLLNNAWDSAAWRRLYRRDKLKEWGAHFSQVKIADDVVFTYAVLSQCNSCYHLSESLYYYYINTSGQVHAQEGLKKNYTDVDRGIRIAYSELSRRGLLDLYRTEFAYIYFHKILWDLTEFMKKAFGQLQMTETISMIEYLNGLNTDMHACPYMSDQDISVLNEIEAIINKNPSAGKENA